MSRCRARLKVTSSPSSRICPEEGSSSPAIMRRVVVLPQPEGPSKTKKSPSPMVNEEERTAVKSPKRFCKCSSRISAMALLREVAGDEKAQGPGQDHDERVGVQVEEKGLHQHENAQTDHHGRGVFPRPATENSALRFVIPAKAGKRARRAKFRGTVIQRLLLRL